MKRGAIIAAAVLVVVLISIPAGWFIFKEKRAVLSASFLDAGDSALSNGNNGAALLSYKKASVLTPKSFAPYYKQGQLALGTGHFDEAIKFFEKSFNFSGPEIAPYVSAGEAYFEKQDFVKAEDYFKKAASISQNSSELLYWIARSELNLGHLDQAREALQKARDFSGGKQITFLLSLISSLSDPSRAIDIITPEMQLEKSLPAGSGEITATILYESYKKMAMTEETAVREVIAAGLLNQMGEEGLGVQKLEEITAGNPKMRDAWVFLSYGYILKRENDKAISALDKAKKLDPAHPFTYYLYAKAYEAMGEKDLAEENYNRANKLGFNPNNPLI